MIKYIKTLTVIFIFWALFICNNSVSEELKNMC